MPTFIFKGIKERGGIPRHSKVRVESLPKRHCVFSAHVSGSAALELDPGKYAFKVGRFRKGEPGMKYSGTFLWGVTEAQYSKLRDLRPKAMKVVNTSEGVRYMCQFTGCDGEFTSRTGAVLHEMEHQGDNRIEIDERNYIKPIFETAESIRAKKVLAHRTEKVTNKVRLIEEQRLIQEQLDKIAETEKSGQTSKAAQTAHRAATAN